MATALDKHDLLHFYKHSKVNFWQVNTNQLGQVQIISWCCQQEVTGDLPFLFSALSNQSGVASKNMPLTGIMEVTITAMIKMFTHFLNNSLSFLMKFSLNSFMDWFSIDWQNDITSSRFSMVYDDFYVRKLKYVLNNSTYFSPTSLFQLTSNGGNGQEKHFVFTTLLFHGL